MQFQRILLNPEDDNPGYRCGQTLTTIGHRLFMFGGCVTDGNDNGRRPGFTGMTNLVHCYDTLYKKWYRIYAYGEAPCARAGHGAVGFGDKLFVQGGILMGWICTGDLFVLDKTSTNQYEWTREVVQGEGPGPRFGHCMGSVGSMLILFGGKGETQVFSDVWALDMTRKPYVWQRLNPYGHPPSARMYASGCGISDDIFLLCGGRDYNGKPLEDTYGLHVHNDDWVWFSLPSMPYCPRFQHASVIKGPRLLVTGGVRRETLLGSEAAVAVFDIGTGQWLEGNGPEISSHGSQNDNQVMLRYRHAAALFGDHIYVYGGSTKDDVLLDDFLLADISSSQSLVRLDGPAANLPTVEDAFYSGTEGFGIDGLQKMVISTLLRPMDWKPPASRSFFLTYYQVAELCLAARNVIAQEPTVLQLDIPVKVFGDIHGQFEDLMSIFKEFGCPSIDGDISYMDYLFLGDYVDRGAHSLETIILLLALKITYPLNIHLIRGNHESRQLNAAFGFQKECIERMGVRDGVKAWLDINSLFDHLPLAALIGKRIFCMHAGLGGTVHSVEQVASIQRPIFLETNESMVVRDLLWSDPTVNDTILGIQPSPRGSHLCCFGPDIVQAFCERNKIDRIIRAHQCVRDGVKGFAQGKLITVFSARNYSRNSPNAGAILIIGRGLSLVVKQIHPLPPSSTPSSGRVFERGSTSNSGEEKTGV